MPADNLFTPKVPYFTWGIECGWNACYPNTIIRVLAQKLQKM